MREIVTLQLGSYANFVGAHFWNFQDETLGRANDPDDILFHNHPLDMDVLYRIGETRSGVSTYTPRLLVVDLQGSLGALRSAGSLYGDNNPPNSTVSSWSGRVTTHKTEPVKKNRFLQRLETEENAIESDVVAAAAADDDDDDDGDDGVVESLEKEVVTWTDYLKVHLHPRSVYEIEGIWNDVTPFDEFGDGKGLLSEASRLDKINDRLRLFVEECDHLQGIEVFVDDSGGFAGVASDVLESVEDDYGEVSMLIFTVRPPLNSNSNNSNNNVVVRSLHDAVSFANISSFGDVIIPMGLPHLNSSGIAKHLEIDDDKAFHTSAVYAAAINSATLPFRMEADCASCFGRCDMSALVQHLTHSSLRIAHIDAAIPAAVKGLSSLTPEVEGHGDGAETIVIQGSSAAGGQFEKKRRRLVACTVSPLAVPLPFPRIFGGGGGGGGGGVVAVDVMTRASTSKAVAPYMKKRVYGMNKYGRGGEGVSVLKKWGYIGEDVDDIKEKLSDMLSVVE